MKVSPTIFVLAGINGAGKSTLGEMAFQNEGSVVFNPDTVAAQIRTLHPDISDSLANGHAWQIGKSLLESAIHAKQDYRFETTLGGRSITSLLENASRTSHRLHVWFCGLVSPQLHIARVRHRVAHGGHHIPDQKIHERWRSSHANLIRLLPHIHHLRVYDNSHDADPIAGQRPQPVLWLETREGMITAPAELSGAPEWIRPIIAAAAKLHQLRTR